MWPFSKKEETKQVSQKNTYDIWISNGGNLIVLCNENAFKSLFLLSHFSKVTALNFIYEKDAYDFLFKHENKICLVIHQNKCLSIAALAEKIRREVKD